MNNVVERNVSDIIDTEYKEYSMYVLEQRAIPSYIDGLKKVGRLLLYAMINEHKGKKTKIADLGGISKFGYHHGEASAMGAAITLTSSWNNNVPIFNGFGNFGSRLIQESAAPRYIFAELNQDFYKYFTDFNVCTKNKDIDCPEPQQYLPIIPWVLVNGIEGIAVGFACKYLPHDPKSIAEACILATKNKLEKNYNIPVTFPNFKGKIIQDSDNKIITQGIVDRIKRNTWLISEVPWGFDREKFFLHLDKMMEQNKIQDFEDQCDDSGFKFLIKLDGNMDAKCQENPIEYFKLERSYTENYTALDENGKIILFNNKLEIIKRFVDFRINKIKERIDYDISEINKDLVWYNTKLAFVTDVVNKKINLLNYKKSELLDLCIEKYNTDKEIATKLISIPVYDTTTDMIESLKLKIDDLHKNLDALESSNPKTVYINMLKKII